MKKPLTVLFNTYPVAFDCPGGGEIQLIKYEQYLTALGIKVLRYDPWNPHAQFDAADIVHYFSLQAGSGRFCRHVTNVRKLPLVVSTIAWFDSRDEHPPAEVGWVLDMSTYNLPNSQLECAQLASMMGVSTDKFIPIVNGVDDFFFDPVSPLIFRKHFDISERFVLCMGNIEVRKNQMRLIQALSGTGIHLVLAGEDREHEYAAQCRMIADNTVHFVGRLDHGSDLQRSAYAAAEALVLPSTMETPGLAALEAAAAGTRLCLTREGCTKEYFQEFSIYLDPGSVADIRRAVLETLACPVSPMLSTFVRERYTWTRAAEQLLAVYCKCMDT
jgi:glycosyltransferase involved in cell wall biosynthesis